MLECLIAGDTCRFVENRQNRYFVQVAMQMALAVAVAGFINEPLVQQAKIQQKRVLMTKRLKTVYRSELTCPHINLTTYKTSLCNENFMQERVFCRNSDFVTWSD